MQKRPALRALTGLRFFAALHVVLFHFSSFADSAPWWIQNIVGTGFVSVSLFFVLSGFILAYTYFDAEKPLDRRSFWANRAARIYPVYLLGLAAGFPLLLLTLQPLGAHWGAVAGILLANIFLVQAWFPSIANSLNGPGWSLSAEAFFYLLFPFVAVPMLRAPRRALFWMAFGAWCASLVIPVLYSMSAPPTQPGIESLTMKMIGVNPALRFFEFVFGMVLGRTFLERNPRRDLSRTAGTVVAVAAVLVALSLLAVKPWFPYAVLHNSLLAPVFGVLIYVLAQGRGYVVSALSWAPLVLLGEASYSLYLLHQPMGDYSQMIRDHFMLHGTAAIAFGGVMLLMIIASSVAVFKLFEEPARKRIRNSLTQTNPTPKPAAPSTNPSEPEADAISLN